MDRVDRDDYARISAIFGSSPLSSPVLQPLDPSQVGNLPENIEGLRLAPEAALPAIPEENEDAVEDDENDREATPELDVEAIQDALAYLTSLGLTWGDLVEYLADSPAYGEGLVRWHGFFRDAPRVIRVLNHWVSWRNGPTARKTIHDWALAYFSKLVAKEARASTKDGFLQSRLKPIDESFILGFSMSGMYAHIERLCPTFLQLAHAFSTTAWQLREMSSNSMIRKQTRISAAILDLLGERSQLNSYKKHLFGLFTYASGGTRQMISVMNTLGVCSSYPTLAGSQKRTGAPEFRLGQSQSADRTSDANVLDSSATHDSSSTVPGLGEEQSEAEPDPDDEPGDSSVQEARQPGRERSTRPPAGGNLLSFVGLSGFRNLGLLRTISLSCRVATKKLAREKPLEHVYDNINFMRRTEEQTLGHKDTMENGTCATVFPLYDAKPEDMKVTDLLAQQDAAPPLTIQDIHLSKAENQLLRQCMEHNILRIILAFGGPGFARFRDDILETEPKTSDRIPVHQTEVHPLPGMPIDESSNTGNAQVLDTIFNELEYDPTDPTLLSTGTVKIVSGDQLSISRLRTVTNNRMGHDSSRRSYLDLVFSPGLFHGQMHAVFGTLDTHWGNPRLGARDPGSLSFHNTVLDRKPIVLSSLPPYRICRDLGFVSLYARVLHCLELVSERSLQEYTASATFEELRAHAGLIYERYASSTVVDKLRRERAQEVAEGKEEEEWSQGDMVFENAVLYLRDSLIVREFCDAIKAGDSGRVLLILKVFAFMYRGTGRTKYAHEMLHLIHNLTHVWPKRLRAIIMKNWLVNPTGHPSGFIPVDLLQEHMNLYIKIIYKAHGSNASWEWLEIIAPCITQLRKLSTQMHETFGTRQGNRHAPPDLSEDIDELMKSLREHRVYTMEGGRIIEGDKAVTPDSVIAKGASQMLDSLSEYNSLYTRLRERRRLQPLIGEPLTFSDQVSDVIVALHCNDNEAQATSSNVPPAPEPSEPSAATSGSTAFIPSEENRPGSLVDSSAAQQGSMDDDAGFSDAMSVNSNISSSSTGDEGNNYAGLRATGTSHPAPPDSVASSDSSEEEDMADEGTAEEYSFDLDLDAEPVFSLETEEDVDIYMY